MFVVGVGFYGGMSVVVGKLCMTGPWREWWGCTIEATSTIGGSLTQGP